MLSGLDLIFAMLLGEIDDHASERCDADDGGRTAESERLQLPWHTGRAFCDPSLVSFLDAVWTALDVYALLECGISRVPRLSR